ncbi:hypothetical protein ACFU3O_12895 [Streptomyces antibioticus]|uniref:hypothetical protein n=1 Tax=Streptomyces antibioticus TaxID=1890 RepID=UPI0036B0DE45
MPDRILFHPLHDPACGSYAFAPQMATALTRARETLAATADANIHDPAEILTAAVGLDHCLRLLVAALDKQAAR